MTLNINILTYDLNTSTASYYSGGTIKNKENTLSSKNGYYHSPSKTLSFKYDVKLKNPDYEMKCDTLQYNTLSRVAYFIGPTTIESDSNTIKTDLGWYNTISETGQLLKNSELISGKQSLKGDSIFYQRKKGYGLAMGNVEIRDTTQDGVMSGSRAEHWEDLGLSLITGKPMLTQYYEKDTLYIWADTFYTWSNVAGPERVMRAWFNCRFYKSDMQGKCDSIVYKTDDSTMVLYHDPLLWNGESQLSSREIRIITGTKNIKYFTLVDNAFVIQKKDSVKYNQIKGRSIEGFFKEDKLDRISVKGNAQAIYFIEQNKKIIGMNKTECSEMWVRTSEKGMDKITFIKKPVASILPVKSLKEEDLFLKGFKWNDELRPKKPLAKI
jgi:lipopolysaccharide export system protein LptA